MIKKAESKIALNTIGGETGAATQFGLFETDVPKAKAAPPPLSQQELKYVTVKELMEEGDYCLDNKKCDQALELFEEVLVIDPANKVDTRKLAEATLGAYAEDVRIESMNPLIGTGIEVEEIQPSSKGQYVALIRVGDKEAKSYSVGDSFGSYRVESIDATNRQVTLFLDEHRGKIVMDVAKPGSELDQRLDN